MPPTAPLDLRAFLRDLDAHGELVTVEAEVDAELELPEIHRRVIAAGGPALRFNRVSGSPFPLVSNLFGTAARVERAFGPRPGELIESIARLPHELLPPTLGGLWKRRSLFLDLARVGLKRRGGPVTEVVDTPPNLMRLPATKSWQRDGGRFLTLPLVYTEHPDGGASNLGMYRVQLFDNERTGLHMQIGKGGGFHLAAAEQTDRPMQAVIHLGGPPAGILGAIAPLPENIPEVLLASLVLGSKLGLTSTEHSTLPVIAEAEFALVGEVLPGERHPEGPFGDHYGYYSETHDYPLFRCRALLRRRDAIFPATVVGKPRQEDFYIGDFLQELLSPLLPLAMPGVRDFWSYGETGYHSLSAAVVHERYKREAMSSAFRILGEGQLSLTKFLIAVADPIDLKDFRAVLAHVLERADFRTDLFLFANLSMDSLDYAGPKVNEGGKGVLLGIGDPIRKLPTAFRGTLPPEIARAEVFCPGCLVLEGPTFAQLERPGPGIPAIDAFRDWPLLVLTDDAKRTTRSAMNFLWTTFTRFNPSADIHAADVELVHNHPSFTPPILIDARVKPWYPEELFCDEETALKVDKHWDDYFPADGPGVEMGDSDRAHLD